MVCIESIQMCFDTLHIKRQIVSGTRVVIYPTDVKKRNKYKQVNGGFYGKWIATI